MHTNTHYRRIDGRADGYLAFLTTSKVTFHIHNRAMADQAGFSRRFTTFSPFVRFIPECPNKHSTTISPVCFLCRSAIGQSSSFITPLNIQKSHKHTSRMKGCLKFNPTPSPGHDTQGQHHNELGQAHCYHLPTTTSSPLTALSPATASSSCTTDAATMTAQTHRKCVAFCAEGSETVYPADEWDRTPAEPARNLSYQ